MNVYEMFFKEAGRDTAYASEQEFREEVMAMLDACLYTAVWYKGLFGERLEMRGVVITPQEFEQALLERRLEGLEQRQEQKKEAECDMGQIAAHVLSRIRKSRGAFDNFRIYRAVKDLKLTKLEWFCYLLAAAVEWDRKYERIYGYLQDDVGAKLPTIGLGLSLFQLAFPAGEDEREPKGAEKAENEAASPLWTYLFTGGGKLCPEESELSRPMKLRPAVLRWLEGKDCFSGSLAPAVWEEEGRLYVDMEVACSMEKEGTATLSELLATAAWAGSVLGAADNRLYLLNSRGIEEIKLRRASADLKRWGIRYLRANSNGKMEPGTGIIVIKPAFTWDDLILESGAAMQLRYLCGRVKYRETVQKRWGFARKSPYGNGVSALFYGPPGTGKTMAAQVVASELGTELLKVDISGLMSKYIGETEKNLNRVFGAAQESDCVLFFDEADGLFAKRTEVSGSNDRYANMETGYLLQKFEEYDGVCILATNCFYQLDDAFKRRIGEMIRFSLPSEETRLKLWNSMVPEEARVDERLEFEFFASRFEMTGSAIKEVITGAAYRAAMEGRGILNEDIREALKSHHMKYGRTLTARDLERG